MKLFRGKFFKLVKEKHKKITNYLKEDEWVKNKKKK